MRDVKLGHLFKRNPLCDWWKVKKCLHTNFSLCLFYLKQSVNRYFTLQRHGTYSWLFVKDIRKIPSQDHVNIQRKVLGRQRHYLTTDIDIDSDTKRCSILVIIRLLLYRRTCSNLFWETRFRCQSQRSLSNILPS